VAGKGGGGAWKVAYADFVTAMMAFFLVMWICAQDQKIKQAIARYFNNPMNFDSVGASKKPDKTGAVFDVPGGGEVPLSQSVAMGRGRKSYTAQDEASLATKLVSDWLATDENSFKYWSRQATRAREEARRDAPAGGSEQAINERTVALLSKQLREEITQGVPAPLEGVYEDLLLGLLTNVNWNELAEDILWP
jgi:flagellar motor protein MotB